MSLLKIIKGPRFTSTPKIEYYLSLPKTIIFNLKYFKIREALKLPVLISRKVNIKNLKGNIIIKSPLTFGLIKIGFGNLDGFDYRRSYSIWDLTGQITFSGKAFIGHGSKIHVTGELVIGKNFTISAESTLRVTNLVTFGDNCLVGFSNLIMDSDFHKIIDVKTEGIINRSLPIYVSDNVWITSRCTILKGSHISKNSVVSSNSLVPKKYLEENIILGGSPAIVIKRGVNWER